MSFQNNVSFFLFEFKSLLMQIPKGNSKAITDITVKLWSDIYILRDHLQVSLLKLGEFNRIK